MSFSIYEIKILFDFKEMELCLFFMSNDSNVLLSLIHRSDNLVNPVEIVRDARVDSRHVSLAATDAPGDDADQLPVALTLADHGAATIALAGILALLAAGADEARMERETVS